MINKLSFLPSESLFPVCLSLDDFEDEEIQSQTSGKVNNASNLCNIRKAGGGKIWRSERIHRTSVAAI